MTDILPENINFQFLAEQQARILTELDRLRTEQHHIRTGQHDMRNEQHHAPGTGASARKNELAATGSCWALGKSPVKANDVPVKG